MKAPLILGFCLTLVFAAENSATSWSKLQISPNELGSVKYGNFLVKIYEHFQNHVNTTFLPHKKYFFAPLSRLDHHSANCSFNGVTKEYQMRFHIEMWNDMVQDQVVDYLTKVFGKKIERHQIQVVPFEKIFLKNTKPSAICQVSNDWLPVDKLSETVEFTLSCIAKKDCDALAHTMRKTPVHFDHFKLLFSLASLTTETKQTTIRIENTLTGDMLTKLLQKFPSKKEVYLTAEDEKRLLTETKANIILESFDDSEVLTSSSQKSLEKWTRDLFFSSSNKVAKQSENLWESVFWNDDNYRPDKTSKKLNVIYRKMDKEDQDKLRQAYQQSNSKEVGGEFSFKIISVGTSVKLADSKEDSKEVENLEKLYEESKDYVKWEGEQFVPKPMILSRLHLGNLRDTTTLKDRELRVEYSTAVLSTSITFVKDVPASVDEWTQLKTTVAKLSKMLEGTHFSFKMLLTSVRSN